MTPKEKAKDLIDKMYNTEHCGIKHFPNKNYCECTEINEHQAKECAIVCVDEMIIEIQAIDSNKSVPFVVKWFEYWDKVKEELNAL